MSENSLALPLLFQGENYENSNIHFGNDRVHPVGDLLCLACNGIRSRRESGENVQEVEGGQR